MNIGIVLYLLYVFVLSCWNSYAGGARFSSEELWDKIAGISGMLIGVIGLGLGFSIIFGVNPLLTVYVIGIPIVGLGIIITVDSWIIYKKTRSPIVLLIALYNTFVSFWNIFQVFQLFRKVKAKDIGNIAKAGAAGGAGLYVLSNLYALLLSFAIGAIIGIMISYTGYKGGIEGSRKTEH